MRQDTQYIRLPTPAFRRQKQGQVLSRLKRMQMPRLSPPSDTSSNFTLENAVYKLPSLIIVPEWVLATYLR